MSRYSCGVVGCRDSEEYKRWKAFQEAEASGDAAGAEAALTELKLRDKDGNEIEKQLPGGKARRSHPLCAGVGCRARLLVVHAWSDLWRG